jgi:hypothetical protein
MNSDIYLLLSMLEKYSNKNGNMNIPEDYKTQSGFALGLLVKNTRQRFNRNLLSDKNIELLDNINFIWNAKEHLWDESHERLCAYHSEKNHSNVPQRYKSPDGFSLGSWVMRQRKKLKTNKLNEDQLKKLKALNFLIPADELWNEAIKHFKDYIKEHENTLVPARYKNNDEFPLGSWIKDKRTYKKEGMISQERIDQLDSLGMIWSIDEESFDTMIHRLVVYKKNNGHTLVPQRYTNRDGTQLGRWVCNRRKEHIEGTLLPVHFVRLSSIGMIWDVLEHQFQEGFAELSKYLMRKGNIDVKQSYVCNSGFKLGMWIKSRKTDLRLERLSSERKKKLASLGLK